VKRYQAADARYAVAWTIIAHAVRAILLASATAMTMGRFDRSFMPMIHGIAFTAVNRRAKGTPFSASMRACPGSEQEGPARAAQCLRERRSGARGRCLFAHLGKPGVGSGEGVVGTAQARFLKRQDSLPVSMISQ
jgi:hypothetical protein